MPAPLVSMRTCPHPHLHSVKVCPSSQQVALSLLPAHTSTTSRQNKVLALASHSDDQNKHAEFGG
jgi:hypothetical protein